MCSYREIISEKHLLDIHVFFPGKSDNVNYLKKVARGKKEQLFVKNIPEAARNS